MVCIYYTWIKVDQLVTNMNKKILVGLISLCSGLLLGQTIDIHHINIGQGDSTLVLGPVDSGGDRVVVLMDSGDRGAGGNLDGGLAVGK